MTTGRGPAAAARAGAAAVACAPLAATGTAMSAPSSAGTANPTNRRRPDIPPSSANPPSPLEAQLCAIGRAAQLGAGQLKSTGHQSAGAAGAAGAAACAADAESAPAAAAV